MLYDYSKLKGSIREKYGKQEDFATAMGIGLSTLNLKLNNRAEWSQEEMKMAMALLDKPLNDLNQYFFTHKV